MSTSNDTPGAVYDPAFPLHKPGQPKYSFGKVPGKKKQGRDVELKGTPVNIGPNSYFKEGYPEDMVRTSMPKFKIPGALRSTEFMPKGQTTETYEV